MIAVLDSGVLIDHLRGDSRALALLVDLGSRQVRIAASVMTRVEVLAGMRAAEKQSTVRLLSRLRWVVVDEELADRAGSLARQYCRSHQGVDPVDYVVAATVEKLNAIFYTCNVKHFPMFAGLEPAYP